MTIYIVLFITLCLCGVFEVVNISSANDKNKQKILNKNWLYVVFPAAIILFMGIFKEVSVGYDSASYYEYYWKQLPKYSWKKIFTDFSIDNGFYFILKIISIFTSDWWLARAILFVLTFTIYFGFILKNSPYPTLSLIILIGLSMLGLMFSILRQALAGAITVLAYQQIKKGSWKKSLLCILIATTIHKTSFLCVYMIVINIFQKKKFSLFQMIIFSALSLIVFLATIPLMTLLYADSRYENTAMHEGGYGMLLFIIIILIISTYLLYITKENRNETLTYLYNLSFGVLFVQIGALIWSLLTRTGVFFSFYWCVLLPLLLAKLNTKERIMWFILLTVLFGYMFFHTYNNIYFFVMHKF